MKNHQTHITRSLIILAMALIGCYLTLTPGRTAGTGSANSATPLAPSLHGQAAIGHLKQTGLYHSLSAALTAARYQIEERKGGGYQAFNPKQGYRTIFTRESLELGGTSRTGGDWRMGMKLTGYGYGARRKVVTSAGFKASGDRIEYERRVGEGGALSEWYVNRATGLEQGFTIPQAPGKRRAGEKLNLWLKLSGDLQAKLAESGQAIMLNGRGEGAGLLYDKLQAFDALGRELEARMKVAGDEVRLEVADEGAIYPVTIDPTFTQQQKLLAADAAAGDNFGVSVAISGETVVVGAPFEDGAGVSGQGSAYVFVRSGNIWSQQQKLLASDAGEFDLFGESVAVDGETIVVGASQNDGAAGIEQGSAYVFVRSAGVWSQQQKLLASDPEANDMFGRSVGISGETVVVGADGDQTAEGFFGRGSAYVFVRSGGVWIQQQKLQASDGEADDFFGLSVAISGETIVVGAPGDEGPTLEDLGSAYVFVRSGNIWSQQQKLEASDTAVNDFFGDSVTISGETIVVGAPFDAGAAGEAQGSAYVFVRSGGVWSQQQKLEASDAALVDFFGESVAISGETIVIGAPGDDGAGGSNQGSTYVFVRNGGVWSQQQKLLASDAAATDQFGNSVAISGGTIVVGAPNDDGAAGLNQGSAYVYATGTKVVFSSNRDDNFEIYVMETDGSAQTRLTDNPAFDGFPAWSPDRSKIVFASTRDGNSEIYVMNSDGSGQTRLTNNPALDTTPAWSPDGSKIAFSSNRNGHLNLEIYVMNADGSAQTRLTNNPAVDTTPTWSPDGSKIAFTTNRHGHLNFEIYSMNANGSAQTRLTNNQAADIDPSWSPDGAKIAFTSTRDGNAEIYSMNANGSAQTRLTNNHAIEGEPSWSPDGSKLVFTSTRDDNADIYSMNANGSAQTRLTNNKAIDTSPDW